jgi:hypothetical protein
MNSEDQNCEAQIEMTNDNYKYIYKFSVIKNEDETDANSYWFLPAYNVQRLILLILLINSIKVYYRHRKSSKFKIKKKVSALNLYSHEFEVQVKINSKKSI